MDSGNEITGTPEKALLQGQSGMATRIEDMQREINSLQVHVMKPQRWYKDAAVIVAAASFAFSAATTLFSYRQSQRQAIHETRVELRGLIEKLSTIPRIRVELINKYSNGSQDQAVMVETLGQEMFLLASQAADLIERLPINEVSTTEYLAVAGALFETGKSLHKAADILSRAESVATDPIERNVALRNNARYLIRSGQSEEGRLKYQQAIDLVENLALNGPSMPVYKAYTNAETLLYEVEDELFTGDCTAAAKTFAEARKRLEFSPNHIDVRYRDYLNGRTIELQSNHYYL